MQSSCVCLDKGRRQGKLLINAVSKVGIQTSSPADARARTPSRANNLAEFNGAAKGRKDAPSPSSSSFLFAVNPSMRQLLAPYLPSGAQIEPPKREMSDGDDHLGSLTFLQSKFPLNSSEKQEQKRRSKICCQRTTTFGISEMVSEIEVPS